MPEQIRCPSCEAALRVPETLMGKNVKCPKCQTTFVAEMEELSEPQGITNEPVPSGKRRRPPPPEEQEEEELPPDEEFDEEEERPRRRRRRRRYSEAKDLISGPATALLVVGIIDIALGLLGIVLRMLGIGFLAMGGPQGRRGGADPGVMAGLVSGILFGVAAIILGSLITLGASKMKNLNSYGLAMTACILAMIPCINCCILGLPFGIWALVVLNKPEVKDAFR